VGLIEHCGAEDSRGVSGDTVSPSKNNNKNEHEDDNKNNDKDDG